MSNLIINPETMSRRGFLRAMGVTTLITLPPVGGRRLCYLNDFRISYAPYFLKKMWVTSPNYELITCGDYRVYNIKGILSVAPSPS